MFAGGLHLKSGAAGHLVRFEPLLRPLIQQRWAQHVAHLRANSMLQQVYELEEFMFAADRISLGPVTNHIRDLRGGKCFYCYREVARGFGALRPRELRGSGVVTSQMCKQVPAHCQLEESPKHEQSRPPATTAGTGGPALASPFLE